MTKFNNEERGNIHSIYVVPIVTVLLSSLLFMGVGFAGITSSSSEVSGYVNTDGVVIKLEGENGASMVPGGFSSNNTITFTKIENQYNIFIGSYKLGESYLIIDATKSAAESISLSADVGYMISGESEYSDNLPYGMTSRFVVEDESGDPVSDLSNITIEDGELNKFNVKFYGDIDSKYTSNDKPLNFTYYVLFKVAAL